MAVNIKKIDLSQFMLNEDDEKMMKNMDKKSSPDEDIKPSVNLDLCRWGNTRREYHSSWWLSMTMMVGKYYDLEDLGMDIY